MGLVPFNIDILEKLKGRDMHFLSLLTIIKVVHLCGLVLGFGGAVLADFTIFTRGVIRPVSAFTLYQTKLLSRIVTFGLVVLWVSGIALIWINLQSHPEYLTNQKLWAKIAIVGILTINGVLIHKKILPILKRSVGYRLFDEIPRRYLAALTFLGSVSIVSWTIPFVLGKATELNYITPFWVIMAAYGACLFSFWVVLYLFMASLSRVQKALRKLALSSLQPNEQWEHGNWHGSTNAILRAGRDGADFSETLIMT
jgi:hypothetical protein